MRGRRGSEVVAETQQNDPNVQAGRQNSRQKRKVAGRESPETNPDSSSIV